MKFFIKTNEGARFFTCLGDVKDKCNTCHLKFNCYTGELPNSLLSSIKRGTRYSTHLNKIAFGKRVNLIKFDYNKFYQDDE